MFASVVSSESEGDDGVEIYDLHMSVTGTQGLLPKPWVFKVEYSFPKWATQSDELYNSNGNINFGKENTVKIPCTLMTLAKVLVVKLLRKTQSMIYMWWFFII